MAPIRLRISDSVRGCAAYCAAPVPARRRTSRNTWTRRVWPRAIYTDSARHYLQEKYAGRKIDALIVEGESTFSFLLQNRDALFRDVPIVHAAVIPSLLDAEHVGAGVTGVVARGACRQTLELARRLQPGLTQAFVVLSMPEKRGRWIEAAIRDELEMLNPPMQVTYLIDLSTSDLLEAIERAPVGSIVLYVRHSDESSGGSLQPTDAVALIAGASPVPVYGVSAGTSARESSVVT